MVTTAPAAKVVQAPPYYLEEVRCRQCHRLLFKQSVTAGVIEVKCSNCNAFATLMWSETSPKGT